MRWSFAADTEVRKPPRSFRPIQDRTPVRFSAITTGDALKSLPGDIPPILIFFGAIQMLDTLASSPQNVPQTKKPHGRPLADRERFRFLPFEATVFPPRRSCLGLDRSVLMFRLR